MTTYTLRSGDAGSTRADAVVVGVRRRDGAVELAPGGEGVAAAYGRRLAPLLAGLGVRGTAGEVVRVTAHDVLGSPVLVLVGMGEARTPPTPDQVRRAAGCAARGLGNAASVALALPAGDAELAEAAVTGFRLGGYRFRRYVAGPATAPAEVVVLSEAARDPQVQQRFAEADALVVAVTRARDWVNTPANDLSPAAFADEVVTLARGRHGAPVEVGVLDEQQLADQGYGGIVGVGAGSVQPPRLVTLRYRPARARRHLGLVGKGITFDSGGLTLKPAASMATMKCDMAGAAAALAATLAVADLGLPVALTTLAPLAENMPSGAATRPGDVLRMLDGQTVEVLNPDAEGRLVMADALVAVREDRPDLLVDVATLTAASASTLGDRCAGVLGTDAALVDALLRAAGRAGELLWPLPIGAEMTEKVRGRSTVADLMQHNQDRFGGAGYAAAFLAQFAGELPWAHVDMAGPAFNARAPYGHVGLGGTGYGVATLVALARELAGGPA